MIIKGCPRPILYEKKVINNLRQNYSKILRFFTSNQNNLKNISFGENFMEIKNVPYKISYEIDRFKN